ncbi:MAG: hypothetical protein LC775_18020 [Acidobacteria bacterium]|nr:hypothetical protein [Acidobacteriota bacterium]
MLGSRMGYGLLALKADTVAGFLEAFGTIAAVIVALFIQVYLVRRSRPVLMMELSNCESDEDFVVIRSRDGAVVEFWARLRVVAKSGRRTARGAQVRLVKVTRAADDPSDLIVPSGPMIWSSVGPEPQSILSGMWLRLDVLRYRIRDNKYPRQLEVEVGYDFDIADQQAVLCGSGEYCLTMLLGADDGETSKWELRFEHAPNAEAKSDDELRHLIRNVRLRRIATRN